MTRIGFSGCLLLLFAFLGMAQESHLRPLTLREAMQNALKNNAQVRAAEAAVEQAEGASLSARGMMLPEISLSARVTRINDPLEINLDPIRSAMIGLHSPPLGALPAAALDTLLPPFKMRVQDKLFYNAAISVQWPIFTGGRVWSGYKAASENVDARKADLAGTRNSVGVEACSRYLTLRLTDELVFLQEQTRNTLSDHVDKARKLQEGGQIALAERLRAEVALAEAERDLEDAMRDRSLARLALSNTIGGDTLIQPVTALNDAEAPADLENLKKRAHENYPGLRRLAIESSRAGRSVTASRGEWFPVVALFGRRELYTKDLTLLDPAWAVGVNLQWDIFQGGQTAGKVQAAKSLQRNVTLQSEKAMADIDLLVEKRWRELEHAHGRLLSLDKTGELAEESLRAQQLAFDSGLATSLDVVDAQLSLARLRMARLKAKYDAGMALAGLLEATGEIEKISEMLEVNP